MLPAAVRAWFEAYRDYVQALEQYNARVMVARAAPFGSVDCNYEFQAYTKAHNKAHGLVHPMYGALAAATLSVPQTHPGETDTYIDSVVQAADAHGRMRNPATQRSLDGAKIDLGRHLRQIASSSKTAPPVQVEDDVLQRAADMLTAYAELVKATGQFAEQHYIPEVEYVVSELQAARGQSEHG